MDQQENNINSMQRVAAENVAGNKFGFVVLHYLVDQETIQCVASILAHCPGCPVVVVDNASNNGSFERVMEQYENVEGVYLLSNDMNRGFAVGNNVGYSFCRQKLGCNYVATCNNDLIVQDDDFVHSAINDFKKNDCGVIGPSIISLKNGSEQNPADNLLTSKWQVLKRIVRYRYELLRTYVGPRERVALETGTLTKSYTASKNPRIVEKLHGACLIFTPAFVLAFAEAFDPRTFLYVEEDILAIRCRQAGLSMLFDPRIHVMHEEDASTEEMVKAGVTKERFVLKENIKSLKVLAQYF